VARYRDKIAEHVLKNTNHVEPYSPA
jgi:hypothetical protein